MGVETAVERPVHTILSGPAAGVIGAVAIAQQAGQSNSISIDMGGTSFDVSLSYRGEVRRTQESELERSAHQGCRWWTYTRLVRAEAASRG